MKHGRGSSSLMTDIIIDKIIRSRRKTIALIVSSNAELVVRAPVSTPLEYIRDLVLKKRSWINRKKEQALKRVNTTKGKSFSDGEGFLFLGETYRMKIEDCNSIRLIDGDINFPERYLAAARIAMIEWYRQAAKEKITERADLYSRITGWGYKSLSVTGAERRWGSCSYRGSINFSWRLIMAPLDVVDYVVVHELAHIVEKNHSYKFWDKVRGVLPDYKERQRWLKENGRNLNI